MYDECHIICGCGEGHDRGVCVCGGGEHLMLSGASPSPIMFLALLFLPLCSGLRASVGLLLLTSACACPGLDQATGTQPFLLF